MTRKRREYPARPVIFDHAGRTYELPPLGDWPLRVVVALNSNDLGPLAGLLGQARWDQLLADGFTLGDLTRLLHRAAHDPDASVLDRLDDGDPALTFPPAAEGGE